MIRYDRLWETMAAHGMSQYRLIKEYHFSAGQIGRLKKNMHVSTHTLDTLCTLLNCGMSDVLEYIPDQEAASVSSKEPKVSPALPEAPEAPAPSKEPEASSSPERSPKASLLPQASLPAPEKAKTSSGKASAKEKKASASKEEKKGKAGKSKKGDKDKNGGKGEKKGKDGKKK